jgi:hypothetical protein
MIKTFSFVIPLLFLYNIVYAQVFPGRRTVPLGGNSFVSAKAAGGSEEVKNTGWHNWQNEAAVWSTYIKLQKAGTLKIAAVLSVPIGESKLKFTIGGKSKTITVTGTGNREHEIGEWDIAEAGYVKIDAQGTSKEGDVFANVSDLVIDGSAVDEQTIFVKNNEGNYFYWGRRGPSVHLNYDLTEVGEDIEWFYNEITVPVGSDAIGSYFMANGFGEGYFGMQVNSPTERRVLFSVWSPFNTDNPKEIPADKKIILLKKGKDVHTGEFGNEGSGGQSYLKYNWKAGEACKFLLKAVPAENNFTTYTAYFYDNQNKEWLLIASFNRPATNTYLKRLHSFLENFSPNTGYVNRKAYYHNQWARTKAGEWKPLHKMTLNADATAGKKYRMDYGGGVQNGKFYLENCGFFNEPAILRKVNEVKVPQAEPKINWEKLP